MNADHDRTAESLRFLTVLIHLRFSAFICGDFSQVPSNTEILLVANLLIVGVISDTHGLLRPVAVELLRGSQHIIHAGDIGSPEIVPALEKIAPVTAIRGNIDTQAWAKRFPETEVIELAGLHLYVIHDVNALDLNPKAAGFAAVISGHSHQPKQEMKDGVLYFNPGSAGPRRFKLPISLGKLEIIGGRMSGKILMV